MKTFRRTAVFFGTCVALALGWVGTAQAQAPSLSISNVTIIAGKMFTLPLDGADALGNPLTFSVVSNSMTNVTAKLVATNRTLRLNVSLTSTTIQTNIDSSSYTTNISLGQGTNVLFVTGAGNAACNGTFTWNNSIGNADGGQGAYANGTAMTVTLRAGWALWDFNDGTADYYTSPTPNGTYAVRDGTTPPPAVAFDGNTPGTLLITTNSVTSYSTNTTANTGDLMLELFEHLTPKTTARIISLANSNFYNGLLFFRVIQNILAQGGDPLNNATGGSGVNFDDEFVYGLTFEGFGQLAMANSGFVTTSVPLGRDNNDSQFFITDPRLQTGSAAPLQYMNYRYTIFGQLTHGFDLLGQIMDTPVDSNNRPLNNVVINSATIITNRQAAVLYLTAPANATGTATITVRAQSSSGTNQVTFQATLAANTVNDPPFYSPMPAALVTTQNVAVSFPFTWWGGSTNSIGLYDANSGSWIMNQFALSYDSSAGTLWLTPPVNFIGQVDLLFTINDGYIHGSGGADELDSQRILLTVVQPNLGTAVNMPSVNWSSGDVTNGIPILLGNAPWFRESSATHDGSAALQSGQLGAVTGTNSVFSWTSITTNGPGSLMFWWKASTGTNAFLGLYINGVLASSISGAAGWQQYVTFLSSTGTHNLTWAYFKTSGASGGADCGWLDQVSWTPCPYAEHVPQLFYQDPTGLLASWVLNSTGGFQFARLLANTGGWVLKAAGDIDGDGVSDLIFETAGGATAVWFMNSDGSTRSTRSWTALGPWDIKACGDYEGLGHAQVFFQNPAGDVAYWRLDTNGNFLASVSLGNLGTWKLRGAGDLDGDHKAELFWQNPAGQIAIWYHNPTNNAIRGESKFSTGPWALCGVADIDGDGVSDLLWQTPGGDTGGWFMNSNSTARVASGWWNTGAWKLRAAGR
jgi:cyclophilin family peptidyl-prolyl cis-trans isomerase